MKLRATSKSRSRVLLLLPLVFLGGAAVEAIGSEKPSEAETVHVRAKRLQYQTINLHLFTSGARGGWGGFTGGGGGGSAPTKTAKEQETDDREKDCGGTTGNPIVLYTGNKVEHELDFASASEMGLFLRRSYNHHWSATGLFGNHWLSNFDYSLAFSDGQNTVWNQRPDGRRIKFQRDPASGRWNENKAQPVAYIVKNGDGSFTLYNDENGVETYNPEGYVTRLRNEQGVAWTFAYNSKYLQTVTHSSGRQVKFTWSGGQVTQVIDPAGNAYQYSYTPNVFGTGRGRLASTTLPGAPATTISYHYEDARYPGGFTGKSLNGVRYSTFAYDENKRATLSEHAGGVERHTISYVVESTEQILPPPSPVRPGGILVDEERGWCEDTRNGRMCYQPRSLPGGTVGMASTGGAQLLATSDSKARPVKIKATETNPLGRKTTYAYEDGRQVSVTGTASPRCAAQYKESSYDANGYPNLVHDFADNLTDFDYSAQGYLLKQVEGVGTPAQRTTTYEWDTARNRQTKASVAGNLETLYTYDARGNIATVTERNLSSRGVAGQSRTTTTTYTYHASGVMASMKVDGPLAQDEVTSVYDANGDLVSVTNALGHVITLSGYNGLGQAGRVTDANGQVREYTYDARGRLTSQRESFGNTWGTTTFGYDGAGNLASVTRPDGVTERYEYDAARRRLADVAPLGDGTYTWTRYSYDAASNITRKEVAHTDYPLGSTVAGVIDVVTHDANWNWFARGWACSTGSNGSIEVHGYAEGTFLAGTQANLASEAGVAAACQAGGNAYRFQLPISLAQRQQLGGRKITIYGLSPQGGAHNRPLGNSGAFAVPPATVVGDIGGVTHDGNGNYAVEGWACSVGIDSPITVHAYVGGSAGGGTFAVSGTANRPTDGNVANACQAKGTAYGFKLPLDMTLRQNHGGKSIHIHGISPTGQAHLVINRSGAFAVPAIVRSAEFVTFNSTSYHIYNGDRVTLTAQVRNTGNVTWDGNTYLAWGQDFPTQSQGLSAPVPPGGVATFSVDVAPYHDGVGIGGYSYVAQMATSGAVWGPRPYVSIAVENPNWHCPNGPNGPNCQEPMRVTPPVWLDAKEGVR
ncbi:DUF6531 domain-containing protein [Stenotrophomonas sp. LGBM10]|uniref:DUF6531 domain-containing protein n=1 Tax=Stenotrophomonas sp. LGBM10 TaxID=3390038 RepID=UPI00398B7148